MQLLAFAKPDLQLDERVLEVDFERNERVAFLLHLSAQLVDLAAVEQQLASSARIDVVVTAHFVRRNMRADHVHFAVFYYDETVAKVDRAKANGLHFATDKHNTRFIGVFHKVIVKGFFVLSNKFFHIRYYILLRANIQEIRAR